MVFIPPNHTFKDRIFWEIFPTLLFGVLFGRKSLTETTGKIPLRFFSKKVKIKPLLGFNQNFGLNFVLAFFFLGIH